VDAKDDEGRTALHVLVSIPVNAGWYHGPTQKAAEVLIAKDIEINARDSDNKTALRIAVENGQEETAKLLHKHGAAENLDDNQKAEQKE